MKPINIAAAVLSAVMLLQLTGCNSKVKIPLSYDSQLSENGAYNESLFYRNDLDTVIADPQVLEITDSESAEYGYYYLFGTTSAFSFEAFRSKDLQNWENVSNIMGFSAFDPPEDNFCHIYLWAPEVIYDADEDRYYMFYSGVKDKTVSSRSSMIGVAVADEPYGPFVPYEDETHNASTPLFEGEKVKAALDSKDQSETLNAIDPHPFVAPDGTKYLYFCRQLDPGDNNNCPVWGVRMNSWGSPDYSTLTRLTRVGYSKTESGERLEYENATAHNEGPFVYAYQLENGKYRYFLAFSINGYTDKSYTVVQAVSDEPLGPYRKLSEEEGGVMLSTDHQSWDHISGPGHHSLLKIGEELFIFYHEHTEREKGNSSRAIAYDRVQVIQNGNGETVLYVNGPTWSLQPKPELFSEYKNIAFEAEVTASRGENIGALTDQLLSLYKSVDFVKEFTAKKSTTITLDFGEYREITGLMLYNSKNYETAFPDISHIELDFKNSDLPDGATAYIDDLEFDWSMYKNTYAEDMRPGGSAVAIFNPLAVKEIRITLKLPITRPEEIELVDSEGYVVDQKEIALSEIAILGK